MISKRTINILIKEQAKKRGLEGDFEIGVKIVSPQKMRELNHCFRHLNEPTDVLSFPIFSSIKEFKKTPPPRSLGDIFLNKDELRNPAHFKKLIYHGIDHLIGKHH